MMRIVLGSLLVMLMAALPSKGQHLLEFNRLYSDRPEEGRFALSIGANGYGVQGSERHGYGNISLTVHFFVDENTEFRLAGRGGGNRLSYDNTDISVYKLLSRSNLEHYAFEMGITRQFSLSRNALMGFSADYVYTYKSFGAPATSEFGVHYITGGIEVCLLNFPVTIGTNYNHIEAQSADDILPQLQGTSFRVWDAYCLVEVPSWKNGNWEKKKFRQLTASVAIGPTMLFLRSSLVEKTGVQEKFVPGIRVSARFASRFILK